MAEQIASEIEMARAYLKGHSVWKRGNEQRLRAEGLFDEADMERQFADGQVREARLKIRGGQ